MTGLPKSIIKKYGVSKKAWKVYRSTKKKSRGGYMPRKRASRSRPKTRVVYRRINYSRKKKSGMGQWGGILGAFVYGAVRERISIAIDPLTRKIPAAGYADEIGMALLNFALAKGKIPFINKLPITRQIGKAGLFIEMARVGEGVTKGMLKLPGNSTGGGSFK